MSAPASETLVRIRNTGKGGSLSLADGLLKPDQIGFALVAELQSLPKDVWEPVDADESDTPAIARQASTVLQSELKRTRSKLASSQRAVDDTKADLDAKTVAYNAAAAAVHRHESGAEKKRDDAKTPLDAARDAHHAAQAAHDEQRAVLEPRIAELEGSIPIAEAREERERLEAVRAELWRRYFASHLRMRKGVIELRQAIEEQQSIVREMSGDQVVHDVLEPVATRMFLTCEHTKLALETEERT